MLKVKLYGIYPLRKVWLLISFGEKLNFFEAKPENILLKDKNTNKKKSEKKPAWYKEEWIMEWKEN